MDIESATKYGHAPARMFSFHPGYTGSMAEQKPQPLDYAIPAARSHLTLCRKIFSSTIFVSGGVELLIGLLQTNPAAKTNICLVGITLISVGVRFRFPSLRIF
jgi:hypothetical protein